jgi:hypothetical protein
MVFIVNGEESKHKITEHDMALQQIKENVQIKQSEKLQWWLEPNVANYSCFRYFDIVTH